MCARNLVVRGKNCDIRLHETNRSLTESDVGAFEDRRVLISELSGQSNILAKTTKYAVTHDKALTSQILARVCQLENEGYEFEAAEASFDLLVKKALGLYQHWFERLAYHVMVETDKQGRTVNEATVKVTVCGTTQHTVSEGDWPVNALDGALRKALAPFYPRLSEMRLVDYKVRVVNAKEATAARVAPAAPVVLAATVVPAEMPQAAARTSRVERST